MKRRQFNTALAAAGLSGAAAQSAVAGMMDTKLSRGHRLERSRFEAQIGKQFIAEGAETAQLKLKSVHSAAKGCGKQQFHVVFEADEAIHEGIYLLKADGKTQYGLHLIPDDQSPGQELTATINLQSAV